MGGAEPGPGLATARLAELATERATLMERIQAIDDEAAELAPAVNKQLCDAVKAAADHRDRFETTWVHVLKRSASWGPM